ncbi:MAG: tyrosine-type recombinase/integrase [Synergistaceae bacterium]|nr:tyrosine-type recombinase/integrase [Synergistaceae bacterium]
MPLTDIKVKALKPREKRYQESDSDGLYIEVMTSGKKYWRLRYFKGGKRSWTTIGEYPATGLQEARERRNDLRKKLRDNIPLIQQPGLFSAIAEEWANAHESKLSSEKYKKDIWSRLKSHILPFIGNKDITAISSLDIIPIITRLTEMHSFEMASRVRNICAQIFRYAISTGRAANDPTAALRGAIIAPPAKRLASLTNPVEVAQLLRSIDAYPQPIVKMAMQFSALTFCRPGEIRHAEWVEISGDEWRIPERKMKMRRPHIVPLSRQAVDVLGKIRQLTGFGGYVFPNNRSPKGDRPMSENTVLVALRSMSYTKDQMTAHGFRSMASTLLNENGFNVDWIERQLAHVEGNSVRAAYNYAEYLPERRKMMQWWADYLDELRQSAE